MDTIDIPDELSDLRAKPPHRGGWRRPWRKPGRNEPCPCGARRTREEILEACERGGGKRSFKNRDGVTSLRSRYEWLERALIAREDSGLLPGLPIKFKDCHITEAELVAQGILVAP